jgi:putative transposase
MQMVQLHPIQNGETMLVTTVTKHRQKVFSNDVYAREAIETLYRVQADHPFILFGFVVMPDHCHFLVHVTAPNTISKVMNIFKLGVSHNIGKGPVWQRRFHIRGVTDAGKALEYIHCNPIRASLCECPEDYPWSSASGQWDVTDLL